MRSYKNIEYLALTIYIIIVGSYGQSNNYPCFEYFFNRTVSVVCSDGSTVRELIIDHLQDSTEKLQVSGVHGRGPLTSIPADICRLKNLKHLNLSNNRITNAVFDFSSSCLTELEILDLSNNFLYEVPTQWISQMISLKTINLSNNKLFCIPHTMFYNISNVEHFDVSSNKLTTFELWLIKIKTLINYSNNPVIHFTNNDNVDLSKYQSDVTQQILFQNTGTTIDFDDGIFEMYNRCGDVDSIDTNILMKAIKIIRDSNDDSDIIYLDCSCTQYYVQKYMVTIYPTNNFSTWGCPSGGNITFEGKCNYQSSFNVSNTKPRLCKINNSEPGDVPEYIETDVCGLNIEFNTSTLEGISIELYDKLMIFNVSDERTVYRFAKTIDQATKSLPLTDSETVTKRIENNFQQIIFQIEQFLQSINTSINISVNSVSILSVGKNDTIYSYSQLQGNDSSLYYSTEADHENLKASITVDQEAIGNFLSDEDIYTFYYLPSAIFRYAQTDRHVIIVSPIVGVHLPGRFPHFINMSFFDTDRRDGRYSCVFWESNQWNDTGCLYSKGDKPNRHFCLCNHTTSFGLIFIPHKTIAELYIPSIVVAILSIVCFCISIFLSIHRQATSFRHLSVANIFTLLNSLILFILLTVILILGFQSSKIKSERQDQCSLSSQNLVIATYFFLISTFASKTLLGIYYFLTIFIHFMFIKLTSISYQWFYSGFLLVILIAIIPIIIVNILLQEWRNLFQEYEGFCWFNSTVIFQFISIPMIIFISLNVLIIFGISFRLFQFCIGRKQAQTNEKRMIISLMIWLSLCISLGVSWMFGPFLDMLITDKNQTSSVVLQWFFTFFYGLEGVWVLIVNVVFCFNQKRNMKKPGRKFVRINKYQL